MLYFIEMANHKKTVFLSRGFNRLYKDEQDYMRNLAHSLLFIQNSGNLTVEKQGKETVIFVRQDGQMEENQVSGASPKAAESTGRSKE
jgi:hypothetical protein